jgi:DNA-binding NtrC family response regulator
VTETIDFGASRKAGPLSFVLLVHHPEGTKRYPIEGTLLLGKQPGSDVVIDAPGVSRYHLEIRAEPDAVLVRDVGSKNGTYYNGARITEVRLGAGAILRVGGPTGTEIAVELASQPLIPPSSKQRFGPLIGESAGMRSIFTMLERTAPSAATILIHGETGTGKELVAQAVHEASPRASKPFVVVDCGAIPHTLIESELFGHRKGSFTDAHADRIGAFESADGGTLFLDEIGELPVDLQPKLLRAVESRAIQRVGDTARRPIDVRLVAATNRNLETEVEAGRFRRDLYFRLAVVTIRIPPLRDRGRDVILLAQHILTQLGQPDAIDFSGPMGDTLLAYVWPGNVRELRNALERAIHLGEEHALAGVSTGTPGRDTAAMSASPQEIADLPFKEAKEKLVVTFERAYVERLMSRHAGNISAASREAGIDRNYLYRLLKKHGLG